MYAVGGATGHARYRRRMDHLDIAPRFVAERFPLAEGAVVGGSTASGARTATSDIDLLLLGPSTMLDGADSLAASYRSDGGPVEVFAYTEAGFEQWAERGLEQCRPVIVDMLVHVVASLDGHLLERLREHWTPVLARGPVVDERRIELLRYAVTDLLDDLHDAHDPFERHVTLAALLEQVAALALMSNGRWLGSASTWRDGSASGIRIARLRSRRRSSLAILGACS